MARKLDPKEAGTFAQDLKDAALLGNDQWSLEGLNNRRDAILSMSPELRAFFDKDARELFSES
jgi:hypothetical protein